MSTDETIERLNHFKRALEQWQTSGSRDASSVRTYINQNKAQVRREVIEARCFRTMTISPPPMIGGLVMRNVDPFDHIFQPPYLKSLVPIVIDMIDETIGVLNSGGPPESKETAVVQETIQEGYAFIAMPMDPEEPALVDVLDAIKDSADRCGIKAERIDDLDSNEKITDRMLESIRKAEYVIADLTNSKCNVFWEAGYAQGIGKTPIYVARSGTKLEFDLKDYPVIFFKNMKELKDGLEKRLRGLAEARAKK